MLSFEESARFIDKLLKELINAKDYTSHQNMNNTYGNFSMQNGNYNKGLIVV